MENEAQRQRLFNQVNPISRSDIDIQGANVKGDIGLGEKWVIDKLSADFILLEYIDINNGEFVDEDGFVVVKKVSKCWRKAVIRSISDFCKVNFGLKYGDTVLLPDDKGLKVGKTQYQDQNGDVKVLQNGVFVNGLKIFATLKSVK